MVEPSGQHNNSTKQDKKTGGFCRDFASQNHDKTLLILFLSSTTIVVGPVILTGAAIVGINRASIHGKGVVGRIRPSIAWLRLIDIRLLDGGIMGWRCLAAIAIAG